MQQDDGFPVCLCQNHDVMAVIADNSEVARDVAGEAGKTPLILSLQRTP